MVARGVGLGNPLDHEMADSYTSSALQLVKSLVTDVSFVSFITVVSLVAANASEFKNQAHFEHKNRFRQQYLFRDV
jgi:hypothetical protein